MSKRLLAIIAMLLSACAAQEETATQDEEQAVRDYILVRGLPEVREIRPARNDSLDELEAHDALSSLLDEVLKQALVRPVPELALEEGEAGERTGNEPVTH